MGNELASLFSGEEFEENWLVDQNDINSPTYKEVREEMEKNGCDWNEALSSLVEGRNKIDVKTLPIDRDNEIERCPRCGESLFGGECVICD